MIAHSHPQVDSYIVRSKPFAQPILTHFRELIHRACPSVEETIKWSRPFFEYRGEILCNISAFKAHCSFGFWGEEIGAVLQKAKVLQPDGMGSLGRITTRDDIPPDDRMLGWISQAATFIDSGQHTSPIAARRGLVKAPKATPEMPDDLSTALELNRKAAAVFAAFSPSCRREYAEWITEAKRPETRARRIATAVDWIAEGKQRNWKYQNC